MHPLDPPTPEECQAATSAVRNYLKSTGHEVHRFVSVSNCEPHKAEVLAFEQAGIQAPRSLEVVVIADGVTQEGHVDVTDLAMARITYWRVLEGSQAGYHMDEAIKMEEIIKAHPGFRAALKRRGLDPDQAKVDLWSTGTWVSQADGPSLRLCRPTTFAGCRGGENFYARPVSGLSILFDLNQMEVLTIRDALDSPLTPLQADPLAEYGYNVSVPPELTPRPLRISMPEGPSFTVNGHSVEWLNWRFRIGFNSREGLVLYRIDVKDEERWRRVAYRVSCSEMVVPYGSPAFPDFFKCAFDAGEDGLGNGVNSLALGCDCLGVIHYWDVINIHSDGSPFVVKNAVCMHEEDHGLLWKHTDWRSNTAVSRRCRRLVVSFIATIANYDYAFYWHFYEDGRMDVEVRLTGIVSVSLLTAANEKYGTTVCAGITAPIHQHFFGFRLHMDVEGGPNCLAEVNVQAESDDKNPHGNAFFATETQLTSELEAIRDCNPDSSRHWKVYHPNVTNRCGHPVAYALIPGSNTHPFARPWNGSLARRAGFSRRHLWASPYSPFERFPTGRFPNQRATEDGLPKYVKQDRSLERTDVVLWYTLGVTHVVRTEDFPIMPVEKTGFTLIPVNFFDRNPASGIPTTEAPRSKL